MNNNVIVDASDVKKMFNNVTGKRQKTVLRKATRGAAQKLTKGTKQEFRKVVGGKVASSRNWWNGKTLQSGIKYVSDKNISHKVHIMGDFRLKFWEMGTQRRYTKKGKYRGYIRKKAFFDPTMQRMENTLADDIKQSITNNLIKYAQSR